MATRGAAFDAEANDSFEAAQPLGGSNGASAPLGAAAPAPRSAWPWWGSTYASVVASQLNNDTYFNFGDGRHPAHGRYGGRASNYDVVVLGDYPSRSRRRRPGAIRTWVEAGLGGIVSTASDPDHNMYYVSGAAVASILDPIVPIDLHAGQLQLLVHRGRPSPSPTRPTR